ncbi:MAG: dihydrodipicolinate synthase family protein [Spiribacter salinus]|uniref:Dihydrodipicolinate synthase family protein n=1 Tax=Spiribacter salinus TaxID=1335746 RepID=A0A540VNA2_9GAMM|nr:MAG: dihydrodipicolinate synthase family protein [Spiribacter salinus]
MTTRYDELRTRIRGPVYSIVTPFREDEEVDWDVLSGYIDLIYERGGRIFYAMAYNSRYSQLTDGEIKELNAFVIQRVKEKNPENICIVGDPIHCSTRTSIEFAQHAEAAGADLISLLFREKLFFEDQVVAHFQRVAEASGIGILVHEMPFLSGLNGQPVNWPISLLKRVADIPSVIAIKEDAKDDAYTREVLGTVRERMAIILSGGGKRQWLRFTDAGAGAWLNGIGVFEPALAQRFWEACQGGDQNRIKRIIQEIEVPFFEQCVGRFGWHLAIKSAMEARAVMARTERMPMMGLSQAEHDQVADVINKLPIDELAGLNDV